jgi:hypothetical protein
MTPTKPDAVFIGVYPDASRAGAHLGVVFDNGKFIDPEDLPR